MEVDLEAFIKSVTMLVVLLNPLLMSIYLMDLIQGLEGRVFVSTLVRGSLIATVVFCLFAIAGDSLFRDVFQVRFASFLIFGGLLFVLIGIQFVHRGPEALSNLRGQPEHLAGSIAMPFMVGPGTVSASVLAGARLPVTWSFVAIGLAMVITVVGLLVIKWLHGFVRQRNASLVSRYIDIVGRASALLIGTIAIDMILNGIELWWRDWQD